MPDMNILGHNRRKFRKALLDIALSVKWQQETMADHWLWELINSPYKFLKPAEQEAVKADLRDVRELVASGRYPQAIEYLKNMAGITLSDYLNCAAVPRWGPFLKRLILFF